MEKCFTLSGFLERELCYGENRRQGEAVYYRVVSADNDPFALSKFELIEGKAPSFINMTDVHRLMETFARIQTAWIVNFAETLFIAVAVKHGNVCGATVGPDTNEVIRNMVNGDPEAISGGIVMVNFNLDDGEAQLLRKYNMPNDHARILDSVIAPAFSEEAVEVLARRKTGKCRLFVNPNLGCGKTDKILDTASHPRAVRGGFLLQEADDFVLDLNDSKVTGTGDISLRQRQDIVLAWAIGSSSNSNTIILVKDQTVIGRGIGQGSRVFACKVALLYASEVGHSTVGAVAYSDSFFPFPDGVETLAEAGVAVVFTSSGSIRDKDVMAAAEVKGLHMVTIPDAIGRGFYGH